MRHFRILIVDDDLSIIKLLRANLKAEGFEVIAVMNGDEALHAIEKEALDLVILDIMLPGIDGFQICERVREWTQVPIIMLSARGEEGDKVKCLNMGADDYVTKPFSIEELIARMKAVLRRAEALKSDQMKAEVSIGKLNLNFAERRVTFDGREIKLTPTEYRLLQELVLNAGKVLTHSLLLGRVWGPEYAEEREYLHVFIGRLRKELGEDQEKPKYIITVPGIGYRFRE